MSENKEQVFGMDDNISPVRASIGSATLPTGLIDDNGELHTEVVFREISGYEEDILVSKMPVTKKINSIIENCIQKIGTIDKNDESWNRYLKSLIGTDRLFMLIRIRMLSLGNTLRFRTACPSCGKNLTPVVNLEDFKVTGMKNPKERVWTGAFPRCGLSYKCKILTGWDEEKSEKKSKEGVDSLSNLILSHLLEVDGKKPTMHTIKTLSIMDRRHLRKEIGDTVGSIDNNIEMECNHCGHEFDSELEIGTPDFFFPSEI